MSKYEVIIICFIVIILRCQGYQYFINLSSTDGKCGKRPIGSVWYDNVKCERLQCIRSDEEIVIYGVGCSTEDHPKNCIVVKGKGDYPSCCPQAWCRDGLKKKWSPKKSSADFL
ncbi:hypothetical protein NPIL_378801 [Nephila pilipes]|uniref:Single domain-containing protein n=1 Tax=Nephila pilipes TaxID=299642 RepID=A0A8X6UIP7_NEPPI|nr:hypothetical protein NPIL_378801 [Nephila pilipes]